CRNIRGREFYWLRLLLGKSHRWLFSILRRFLLLHRKAQRLDVRMVVRLTERGSERILRGLAGYQDLICHCSVEGFLAEFGLAEHPLMWPYQLLVAWTDFAVR